jgi:alpha-1,2-mannosyltransferase
MKPHANISGRIGQHGTAAGGRMISGCLIDGVRRAGWLTRGRVFALGQALLLAEVTVLVLLALWQHGVLTNQPSATSSDFVSFYAAGKLALAGTPALAYDQAAHFLIEQRFSVAGAPYQYFFYPPVLMLLFAPLALLPYYVAFYVFEFVTLAAFLLVMRCILRQPGWIWVAPVLAFPAVFWTLGLGQNAFLTAALFGGFTVLIDRRPVLAGVALGLLCYKPHFGLLAPVALLAGGHWRAILAAGVTVAALAGLSFMLFGIEAWSAYLAAFAGSDAVYSSGRIDYAGIVTPFGAARLLGLSAPASYLTQAIVSTTMAVVVAAAWRNGTSHPVRGATLLAATLLAVPLALLYDRVLLLVAMGWVIRDGRRDGFLPWEKIALLGVYVASLGEYAIASAWRLPIGPAISAVVLLIAMRRLAKSAVVGAEVEIGARERGGLPVSVR